MQFKIRPFERVVSRGSSDPESRVEGLIDSGAFVLVVDGARFPVLTADRGEDDHGVFAIVAESDREVNLGFHVVVEVDPDEDSPREAWGCRISLFKPNPNLAAIQEANPEFNVLMPPDSSISIYFGPAGYVNGCFATSSAWDVAEIDQ